MYRKFAFQNDKELHMTHSLLDFVTDMFSYFISDTLTSLNAGRYDIEKVSVSNMYKVIYDVVSREAITSPLEL